MDSSVFVTNETDDNDHVLKIEITTSARLALRHGLRPDGLWNSEVGKLVANADMAMGAKAGARDWNLLPKARSRNSETLHVPKYHVDVVRRAGFEPQEFLNYLLDKKGLPNAI